MKRRVFTLMIVVVTAFAAEGGENETFHFGRFGKVAVYRNSPIPSHVVLFVSGDGGWKLGVVDMAKAVSSLDALVVGIDITYYLKEMERSEGSCSYPAADFELLSKFIQKTFQYPHYIPPLMIGYSSGATLVYAMLTQSPPNTFGGAMSLGFCPDLPLTKPLCRGNGLEWKPGPKGKGYSFLPAKNLSVPWIAFQGSIDQVCDPAQTEAYVKEVSLGEIIMLPKVGHGFSVQRNWMPQFKEAFLRFTRQQENGSISANSDLRDLPIVEVPAKAPASDHLAVILSGDGGWAGIDREVASCLSERGVPVVGLNSLQYFWKGRNPEESAKDLGRILSHYLSVWQKKSVILIGYSLGADVLPFMATRLFPDLLNVVSLIALLGPSQEASFEFHLTDWLNGSPRKDALPVGPEVEKLRGKRVLCFCGESEEDTLCRKLDPSLAKVIVLKGHHHFGGEYKAIANTIFQESKRESTP